MLRKLFVQASHYSASGLLLTLSTFISFPILTRIFTVEQYGILNLVSTTLMLLVGLGKAGLQTAVVRFYSEVRTGKRDLSLRQYCTTSIGGMLALSSAVAVLWILGSLLVPRTWLPDPALSGLFLFIAILIPTRVVDSGVSGILRAQQRSGVLAIYTVVKKYAGLAMILVTLLWVSRSLYGFYAATCLTEVSAVIVLAAIAIRSQPPGSHAFSTPLFRDMLGYGLPMSGYEAAGNVLGRGDRYVVQADMGSAALGTYSAAYNACEYVGDLLNSLQMALAPIYLSLWEEKGRRETEDFLAQSLQYFALVSFPMVAGLSAIGPEFLSLLAGDKYLAGSVIIPLVVAGLVVDGFRPILAAGLYVGKQTRSVMVYAAGAALFNVILNLILVPLIGLQGAAFATFASYLALALLSMRGGAPNLTIRVPWFALLKVAAASAVMYLCVIHVHLGGLVPTLCAKIAVGAVSYLLMVLAIDDKARRLLRESLLGGKPTPVV